MGFKKIVSLLLIFSIFPSCAIYAPQYKEPDPKPIFPSQNKIEKTFYLIGDAGLSPMGGKSNALIAFQKYLKNHPSEGDYTLFLGDNIYPSGMDPEGDPKRASAENMINAQYETVKDFKGPVYFIPGNHEWYNGGVPGVKREEDYIEKLFGGKDAFRPSNGCPLESVSISDDIQLIMIDTQWYLEDWNVNPGINQNCEIKSRDKFFIDIEEELEIHQNKTIVFAMHHPMLTNGSHGGYFGGSKHIYPTQQKWPLPFLSSLVIQIRSQGGVSIQDRYNELYNNLMIRLKNTTKNSDRLLFVSGHEHSMQYLEEDGVKQVVSGSGSKDSYASLGKDGLFATGAEGFVVLTVFENGSSWVQYYIANETLEPELVYEKEVFPPNKNYDIASLPKTFATEKVVPIYKLDSINESLFLKTVWGSRYQDAYSTPIKAKVARLDSLFGGVTVIREGGQKEYRSLRLSDTKGNEYRMRALGKNSLGFSQKIIPADGTEIPAGPDEEVKIPQKEIFNADFYTSSHPYAVLAIPKMAKAVDVFYTDSKLYYVPKQSTLGDYNDKFGDELYLISIEPTESSEGEKVFKYPNDIQTTDDILTKIRKGGDIIVDEENYIRSRLFDMLIGDWDRESDHWRWAEYYNRYGKNVYVPIPRNRDDAFSSFDGNILNVARSIFSGSRQTHVYDENLIDLEWFNEEGIILDRALLERSGREQWQFVAKQIQDSLSTAIIEDAFNEIPQEVQNGELQKIKETLIARKKNLVDIANRYYDYLSNLQTITGTDEADYFEITREPDGKTNVKTYRYTDGKKGELMIKHTYYHKDTNELWIYGLDGDDVFEVNGKDSDLIYIRVIGGNGLDVFKINEGRRVKFYDSDTNPSIVAKNEGGSLIFTDIYDLNTYDYRKQIDDSKRVAPAFGYNPDDGFRLGLQFIYTVNSFKRNPFSKRHNLTAGYYFDTSSFDINYEGEFANSIGDSNLKIGTRITSPNYTVNYFGYGNQTENGRSENGYDFNRIELQTISARAGLVRNSSFGSVFTLQTRFEAITLNNTMNNLYQDKGSVTLDDTNYFGTVEGIYNYRSYDNPSNPARGMLFDLSLGITDNLVDVDNIFGVLASRIVFYNALTKNEKLVLKTNIQTQINFGDRFQFYHGAQLGANNGLRGYREERFTGKSFLVGSVDVRYNFDQFLIELFPVQIGIYGGADLGRVWIQTEDSQKWHNSQGGGFWINGQGGLGTTFSVFSSKEGMRYAFGIGFTF